MEKSKWRLLTPQEKHQHQDAFSNTQATFSPAGKEKGVKTMLQMASLRNS